MCFLLKAIILNSPFYEFYFFYMFQRFVNLFYNIIFVLQDLCQLLFVYLFIFLIIWLSNKWKHDQEHTSYFYVIHKNQQDLDLIRKQHNSLFLSHQVIIIWVWRRNTINYILLFRASVCLFSNIHLIKTSCSQQQQSKLIHSLFFAKCQKYKRYFFQPRDKCIPY